MESRPNRLAGPLIALTLLIVVAAYVVGYFVVSEVHATLLGEVRVFPSEAIYNLYIPIQTIEERFTGRQTGFSE
jgi:membrane protein YdbS with pleckstrin-like domain